MNLPPFLILALLSCGDVWAFKPDGRIVGGEPTTIEEYPYQVSVVYNDRHDCGGSIINERYVLTAAHCTYEKKAEDLLIRVGTTYVEEGGQLIPVQSINQHSNFSSDTYDNDISVLRLSINLIFANEIQPVRLPPSGSIIEGNLDGIATGWGRLYTNGPLPKELQKVVLPTFDEDACAEFYGNKVTARMFCAGYADGQKDTCQGDSGGPFAYDNIILGITSWGDGCGLANSPGVYTKVSDFIDFIDKITSLNV